LAAPGSNDICGWCAVVTGKDGLRAAAYGVFSSAGVTPFRTWLSIKSVLLDPPAPPFVAVYATKNNQHMAWRAPISFSRDLFYVRVGDDSLLIRRSILNDALAASSRLRAALDQYWLDRAAAAGRKLKPLSEAAQLRAKSARRVVPHVFVRLASDLKDPEHGVIIPTIYQIPNIREGEASADLRLLENLTLGELWAMTFVTYLGAAEATESTEGEN
jgi:CRISPR type IV-associated protein Csf1